MGIFDTWLMAAWANGRNRNIARIRTHAVDYIEGRTTESLILVGGQYRTHSILSGENRLSMAGEVKTDTVLCAIGHACRSGYGTVCFYDKNCMLPFPELNIQSVVFGRNASYLPLNMMPSSMTEERINAYFERIVKYHCRDNSMEASDISGILRMYINILASKNINYVTVDNLDLLVEHGRKTDVESFQIKVKEITGDDLPQAWENYNILNWDLSQTKFQNFWQKYKGYIRRQYKATDSAPKESLYSAMTKEHNTPCICALDTSSDFLKIMLLSELEMIYGDISKGVMMVDYFVRMPIDEEHNFFSDINMCMIGDTLKRLGIEPGVIRNPTVDCLGVDASDAADIINYLVASSDNWRVGVGGAPVDAGTIHAHLHREIMKALQENGLSLGRIPDGSAVRINGSGITNIRQLNVNLRR